MVVNVDNEIPDAALEENKTIPGVQTAYKVSLPPAQPKPAIRSASAGR